MEVSEILGVNRGVEDCCARWPLRSLAGGMYMIKRQDMRSRECTERWEILDYRNAIHVDVTYAWEVASSMVSTSASFSNVSRSQTT